MLQWLLRLFKGNDKPVLSSILGDLEAASSKLTTLKEKDEEEVQKKVEEQAKLAEEQAELEAEAERAERVAAKIKNLIE